MITHKFFKATQSPYEQTRMLCDAHFGYPNGYADTSFPEYNSALKDNLGFGYLALSDDTMIQIAREYMEEISKNKYMEVVSQNQEEGVV